MPSLNFTVPIDASSIDKMRMLNHNVLIETFDNRHFQNGVYVAKDPDVSPFVPMFGIVRAVDPDDYFLKVGMQVCFEKYKGDRGISTDGKRTFMLLKSSFVLAEVDNSIDVSKL